MKTKLKPFITPKTFLTVIPVKNVIPVNIITHLFSA